jgi:23S rRNA pseudouridine2605 synthase
MRINKFLALHTSLSRRSADMAITENRVKVNGKQAEPGLDISEKDSVLLDDVPVHNKLPRQVILLLHKPTGYVCSRNGQGSKTIYDLLPNEYKSLKPAGRLDKYSSGLLLMTNDGDLINELTHPKKQKDKIYRVVLDKPLQPKDQTAVDQGVKLADGLSKLQLCIDKDRFTWIVKMHEGRNRQIRRTFSSLGYEVIALHRTNFGNYDLTNIAPGNYRVVN